METAEHYFEDVKKVITTISDKPWGQLVNFTNWELAVPEAYQPNIEFHIWLYEKGLRFKALVARSSVPIDIIKNRVKTFDLVESKTFVVESLAFKWLRSKGIYDK